MGQAEQQPFVFCAAALSPTAASTRAARTATGTILTTSIGKSVPSTATGCPIFLSFTINEMTSASKNVIDIYRHHATAWAKLRAQRFLERPWLDRFLNLLPNAPSVLDIGCGSGEPIGRYLIENGCKLTGIDASPELIQIAKESVEGAAWLVSDMRALHLGAKYDGILAWNSTFHLTPEDQRQIFPVLKKHAAQDAVLMFTSGSGHGTVIGEFEGESLYHASLDGLEYRALLEQHGFGVVEHVIEDPDCGHQTVWLARAHGMG